MMMRLVKQDKTRKLLGLINLGKPLLRNGGSGQPGTARAR